MASKGWVKITRELSEWEHFRDGDALKVWMWLLTHTFHEDCELVDGTKIKAGQVVYSIRSLAKECGMSERKVRTVLAKLEATHEMTHKSTHSKTVGTIEKWASYQGGRKKATHKTTQKTTTKKNIYKEYTDAEIPFGSGGIRYHS